MQKVISVNYIPRLSPPPWRGGGEGKRKRRQGELITLPVLLGVGEACYVEQSWKGPKSPVENRFGGPFT